MVANGLKVQIAVQRALHNPSQGIRVLASETIGHFLRKYKLIYFLTTNALARPHALCNHTCVTAFTKRSGGRSTQIKYLSKSTDTYYKILLQ